MTGKRQRAEARRQRKRNLDDEPSLGDLECVEWGDALIHPAGFTEGGAPVRAREVPLYELLLLVGWIRAAERHPNVGHSPDHRRQLLESLMNRLERHRDPL